jgi:hypothetical protein
MVAVDGYKEREEQMIEKSEKSKKSKEPWRKRQQRLMRRGKWDNDHRDQRVRRPSALFAVVRSMTIHGSSREGANIDSVAS